MTGKLKQLLTGAAIVGLALATPLAASAQEMPGKGTTIKMARPSWDTGWFDTEIYRQLLETLGYEMIAP